MRLLNLAVFAVVLAAAYSFTGTSGLVVTSSAFTANSFIPVKYSCEGQDINPPLKIAGYPAGTKSLALVLHDPDAPMKGGFTHWVMWNIEPGKDIPEQFKGAEHGTNSAKRTGYVGMCPPSGTHHYNFKCYALDTRLVLSPTTDMQALEKAMQGHIIAEGVLTGLYKKTK